MLHAARVPAARPAGTPSRLDNLVVWLVAAAVLTGLLSWRFELTAWEVGHCLCQLSLFVLGCWLLPHEGSTTGSVRRAVGILGATFTILRFVNYIRVALVTSKPSHGYIPLLTGHTLLAYTGFCMYAAEGMLMQVLLRHVLCGWQRILLGVVASLLFARILCRYNPAENSSTWGVIRTIIISLLGECGPYYLLTHKWVRQVVSSRRLPSEPASMDVPMTLLETSSKSSTSEIGSPSKGQRLQQLDQSTLADAAGASSSSAFGLPQLAVPGSNSADCTAVASTPGTGPCRASKDVVPGSHFSQRQGAACRKPGAAASAAAIHALSHVPYRSQLRATRTVCVKLDTQMRCESLPPNLSQQLQSALRASIGQATSLSISDVAVRPGCICITMKLDEKLLPPTGSSSQPASSMQTQAVAEALLPSLQQVLNSGYSTADCKRATLQLDGSSVMCIWQDDRKAWDIQVQPTASPEAAVDAQPWLGIAAAFCVRSASTPAGSSRAALTAAFNSYGQLEILAEVQLWGVSKVAEVEGWTPPVAHLAMESDWPAGQRSNGSAIPLKLLARMAGGYLSTQVVRLSPGETSDYVTAQVLLQLHEHQLVRHHDGGSPSTLLLLDLELWQNEVLLSSSPLISIPGTGAGVLGDASSPSTWWWGAADRTAAAALWEVEQCGQQFMLAATAEGGAAAIQTYVRYVQDLAIWLGQVQRKACRNGLCRCRASYGPGSDMAWACSRLRQPCLSTPALCQLGQQLVQYAKVLKWHHVHCMVSQQMRSVVQRASSRKPSRQGVSSWVASITDVVLGYPCHHDELRYKQHMAIHLSGVLVVSSMAIALIGIVWAIRASWMSISAFLAPSWMLLQAAALITMLRARPTQPGASAPGRIAPVRLAFFLAMLAYVWRSVVHLGTALWNKPYADDVYITAFQQPHFWLAMESVLVLSEQVPASVVLPAPWVFGMALLMEYPAVLLGIIRSSGWHPITCAVVSFPLVVCVRLMLDAQLRRQLAHHPIPSLGAVDLLRTASTKSD